jgi:hypothetical protein
VVTSYEAQVQRDNKQQLKIRGSGKKNEAKEAKYLN